MAASCIFCKIVAGEIPSTKVHEDDSVIAFRDLNPQAPHHILVIPRQHIATIDELPASQADLGGRLFLAAAAIAKKLGFAESYRLVVNRGSDAGQTVYHIHLHLLAGRRFGWPPG